MMYLLAILQGIACCAMQVSPFIIEGCLQEKSMKSTSAEKFGSLPKDAKL